MLQEFVEAIDRLVQDKICDIHTAVPAEVVEFNQDDCTVDVLPRAKMITSKGKQFDYPRLNNVPLLFPCGAGLESTIVFPVKKGDGCLLIFSEQALDCWRNNGFASAEMKFDLSNAIAIPGLFANPSPDTREASLTDSIIIRNGANKVSISRSKIAIKGDIELDGNLTLTGEIRNSHNA